MASFSGRVQLNNIYPQRKMVEKGRDEKGPFMQMQCGIEDIRLMYTAINFYLENWPGPESGDDGGKELNHLKAFHKTLYSMILEYNFHNE